MDAGKREGKENVRMRYEEMRWEMNEEGGRECARVCEMAASGGKRRKFEMAGRKFGENSGGNSAPLIQHHHNNIDHCH
jgi:hypothetical protein